MIRVGPWRRAAPKAQDRVPRRGTTLRSGMKNDMRRSVFLTCHEGRSGGKTGKPWVREKQKKEAPRCGLSEGACVHMAAVQLKIEGFARDDETGKE